MDTIQQRIDRAAVRWARATISRLSTRQRLQASEWRINVSRLVLDYPRLARIRGGAEMPSESAVRDRIRELIRTGVLSHKPPVKMFAGPGPGTRSCAVCGGDISKGEVEFEAELPDDRVIVFHRRCADLWSMEGQAETA
jgi:hypothetical protein